MKQNLVKILTTHLDHTSKDTGYFICVPIKYFKKSFLKHVCKDVSNFLSSKTDSFPNQKWCEMTSDLSEPRIYNPPASKTMMNISKIINDKNLNKKFPTQFNKANTFNKGL